MAFFRRSGTSVCIDILDTELRVALVRGNEGKDDDITQHESLPLAPGIVQNGRIADAQKYTEALKHILEKFPKGNSVLVALPPATTYSVYLKDRKEAPKNKQTLQDIVAEWFPVSPADLTLESQWFSAAGTQGGSICIYGIETKILDAYKKAFKDAGVGTVTFFPRSLGMARVAFGAQGSPQMDALLDLSMRPMVFTCVLKGAVIDERLLFGEKVEEAYAETLLSWSSALEEETKRATLVTGPLTPEKTKANEKKEEKAEEKKEDGAKEEQKPEENVPQAAPAPVATMHSMRIVVIGTNPMPFDPLSAKIKNLELKPEMLPVQEPIWLFGRGLSALSQSKTPVPKFT